MDTPKAKIAIEINDAGLILVEGDVARPPSPGVAVWDGGQLFVGAEAWSRCRRLPGDADDRFWDRLGQQPLARPLGPARSAADLAHAHLAAIWKTAATKEDGALLTVTGAANEEHIALVLGIAESAGIPVRGVVDAGLACALEAPLEAAAIVHADTQLHRAVVTRIEAGEMLVRAQVALVNPFGLQPLTDRWLRFLADCFVRTTRFDPLDRGEDEQRLFDQLPACLASLQEDTSAPLELQVHERVHAITVKRDELRDLGRTLYEPLLQEIGALCNPGEPTCVQLSARLCGLPGLVDLVRSEVSPEVMELAPGAGARALLAPGFGLPASGSGVPFVTRTARPGSASPHPSLVPPARDVPSHLVGEGEAVRVTADPLYLVALDAPHRVEVGARAPETASAACSVRSDAGGAWLQCQGEAGVYLNGTRVEGKRALRVNDRIRIAGTLEEFTLVARGGAHGA